MKSKIQTLLEQKLNEAQQMLKEDITIVSGIDAKKGEFIGIGSDNSNKESAKFEVSSSSYLINLANKSKGNFSFKFQKPEWFTDDSTGNIAYGYKASGLSREKKEEFLNNLKTLADEIDIKSKELKKPYKAKEGYKELTIDTITELKNIVDKIEATIETSEEEEKELRTFLEELLKALESDEIFEFLDKKSAQISAFRVRNSGRRYSVLNSLIILYADPMVRFAGPVDYWKQLGFRIKNKYYKNGIKIWTKIERGKNSKKDMKEKAAKVLANPEHLERFKKLHGIPNPTIENDNYQLSVYYIDNMETQKRNISHWDPNRDHTTAYTDKMVEPIPGVQQRSPEDVDYSEFESFDGDIAPYYDAISKIAEKNEVDVPFGVTGEKNMTNFNKILHAVAVKEVIPSLKIKDKKRPLDFYGWVADLIISIVKKRLNLPIDEAAYRTAKNAIDIQDVKDVELLFKQIFKHSLSLVAQIKKEMEIESAEAPQIAEVRKLIRNLLNQ